MFQTADTLSLNAFYIAADDWTQRDGRTWGIGKRYGAFRDAMEFVTNFLEISPNRCFYEIIRNSRPCKAYLDLEADAGAMSEQEGEEMCAAVNREWKRRVTSRWPTVIEQCKQSLGHMILNGSRMTDKGLKISYHIIYPWLVFPCNTTTLRDEVGSMSEMPQFHYSLASGERKSFIDPGVYTSNRQFRLLLCNKLSDRSRTALRLSQHPTLSLFLRSCITHIGNNVGLVPHDDIPRMLRSKHSGNKRGASGGNNTGLSALTTSDPLGRFLHQLLQKQGQPKGILTQPTDHWKRLNFDGVYPLVNRAHVILLASGGLPRQSTRVMEHGCQLLAKEK
jgi:hypothetical protein